MDLAQLKATFNARYGNAGPVTVVRAPGRVNLIGEHTDYNDGFVCPMAIERVTYIVARPRPDAVVRMFSLVSNEETQFNIDQTVGKTGPKWSLYPRGMAEALRLKGLLTTGCDCLVASDVPLGGGLSSSASFEVATGLMLLKINGKTLPLTELALAAQWAEHQYPGMPCGIMDQFISAMGQAGHALLLDCRDQSTTHVPMDDPSVQILIVNSNVKHELVQGEYAARRNQCQNAVSWLKKKYPAIKSLRDVTLSQLDSARLGMDPVYYKRAKHVISEIARTTAFATALSQRDHTTCGKLMYASHESLQHDYSVSCKELDLLVELCRGQKGVYGARMTGGGFGGCIVALVETSARAEIAEVVAREYNLRTRLEASLFATVASAGASVIE